MIHKCKKESQNGNNFRQKSIFRQNLVNSEVPFLTEN